MGLFELLVLCLAIAANNLVVSIGLGTMGQAHLWKRVVIIFGVFEFCIPLVGLLIGKWLSSMVTESADVLSASIIIAMGVLFIMNAFRSRRDAKQIAKQITKWKGLILLAAGLSIDNLAIGLGLGLGDANPLFIAGLISIFSMTFSYLGLHLGRMGIAINRKVISIITGCVLIIIGGVQIYRLL